MSPGSPLVIEFEVACDAPHAFATWTTRLSTWWPRDHTVSGDAAAEVEIEPRPGGRILERSPDGAVHTWGTVTDWEPPRRLAYLWHLGQDPTRPTTVDVRFEDLEGERCRVVIEHGGWEHLGSDAEVRRKANRSGWEAVLPAFVAAAGRAHSPP